METEAQTDDTARIAQSRAEQLLLLRAPLIERGKRVPALERSVAAYEVETAALAALFRMIGQAEKQSNNRLKEAGLELDIAKLETDLVREKLRATDARLAEISDLSHVKETAHKEEVAELRKRCVIMKRKIQYLTNTEQRELRNRIEYLESRINDSRKDILDITKERDEWRESATRTEQALEDMKARQHKVQSISALLQTERTLSAKLKKELKEAKEAATAADTRMAKLSANSKTDVEKRLTDERKKTAELQRKLKSADASAKKLKSGESKLQKKCDDLDQKLQEALARAAKSEERFLELENVRSTRSRGLPSPRFDGLMSPAPLTYGRHPAADMASESKSRFTDTLPAGLHDLRSSHSDVLDDLSVSPQGVDTTPRAGRRKAKPQKLSSPRKTAPKRAPRRGQESTATKEPDTKKRRRVATAKEADSLTDLVTPKKVISSPTASPRLVKGKAMRKTPASSPTQRLRERAGVPQEQQIAAGSEVAPRRTLRSRRQISYNYDEEGRDVVNALPGYEVDFAALQPVRSTRDQKNRKPGVATRSSVEELAPDSRVTISSRGQKRRRMETVRKQVPGSQRIK